MKRLITGILAAAMLAVSPVWAHDGGHGHGHGRGHDDDDHHHGRGHFDHRHRDFDDRDFVVMRERPRVVERRVTVIDPQPVAVQQPVVVQDPPVNIVIPLR